VFVARLMGNYNDVNREGGKAVEQFLDSESEVKLAGHVYELK
jgi:hypothetical protein